MYSVNEPLTATSTNNRTDLHFIFLPAYAQFLLENKLNDFAKEIVRLSRELNIPLMRYFTYMPEEQLVILATESNKEFLTYLAQNQAREFIDHSFKMWAADQIPLITRDQVAVDDIMLICYTRKKCFLKFLPEFTTRLSVNNALLEEVDEFTLVLESQSLKKLTEHQKELYKQAQSLTRMGSWTWDRVRNKLEWTDELYRIYELETQSEISNEKIAAYNHPDDEGMVIEEMQKSWETNQSSDFYYRIVLGDKEKTLHAIGTILTDVNGKAYKMFGTLQDVTEQKQIEKELKANRNFLHKIANVAPSLISAYNIHTGEYIFINSAVQGILGYSTQDFLDGGAAFAASLIHPDDLEPLMTKNMNALKLANAAREEYDSDAVESFVYRMRHKNGEYRWIYTHGTVFDRDRNHQVQHLLNISVDVSDEFNLRGELEKKNEDLRKSKQRYERMVSEVQDYAILLLDKQGIIQNWNKGAEKIKGYSEEEITGKNFRVFYPAKDQERKLPEKLLREATRNGKAVHEGWRVRKDGVMFWGSIVITALHDEKKNVIGFSKVTRDLTERKMAEDRLKAYANELETTNSKLERINKELSSFTYVASHDLQEPLRKIQIFSNRILETEYQKLSSAGKESFERMKLAASRMQKLLEDLLAFSRTNTSGSFEPVDLNVILYETSIALKETIEEKGAVIRAGKLPMIKGIHFQFQQLFENLIGNAIKYSKAGTVPIIKITSKIISEKRIKDPAAISGKTYFRISIADNGIGFDQNYAHKIFEIFQRLHGKHQFPGTGIGLAICKKIVENHYGFIRASGKAGKGATFEIYLPTEI